MNVFKLSKGIGVMSVLLIVFSTTVHAHLIPLITSPKRVKQVQESLFSSEDLARTELHRILEKLNIKEEDLSEKVFRELMDARDNPSRLFRSRKSRNNIPEISYLFIPPSGDTFSLGDYRSAIEVLQSDVHRDFFFSLFDPSNQWHIEDLFMGLRVHKITLRESPVETVDQIRESVRESVEIADQIRTDNMGDEWVLFTDMAEQAISKGHIKVGIIDIEAGFISALGERDFLSLHRSSSPLTDSFKAFTDSLISEAEESGRLVALYKNPYFNLSVKSPYRGKFLSTLQKSDLSDKDTILKWWKDTQRLKWLDDVDAGVPVPTKEEQYKPLREHIESSFNLAKKDEHFDKKALMEDPFISELIKAAKENERLSRATNEIFSSLGMGRESRLQDYDIDNMTR